MTRIQVPHEGCFRRRGAAIRLSIKSAAENHRGGFAAVEPSFDVLPTLGFQPRPEAITA